MSRQLASLQQIEELKPIEGRDRIELARIEGWWVIVQKGNYKVGDLVVYFEVDSVLPDDPRWAGDLTRYGNRVRCMKMAGVYSQGYTMPITQLTDKERRKAGIPSVGSIPSKFKGVDLTEAMGVTKYEPDAWNRESNKGDQPVAKSWLAKLFKSHKKPQGNLYHAPFPKFLHKTDETRVQKLGGMLKVHEGKWVYVTEKLHGSSMTLFLKDNHFGVCSRNLELLPTLPALPHWKAVAMKIGLFKQEKMHRSKAESPIKGHFWQLVFKEQLEEKLRNYGKNIAIQGEIVGPGICDNIYKLGDFRFYMFSAYDIDAGRYLGLGELIHLAADLAINTVPLLVPSMRLHADIDQWLAYAEGKSQLNPSTLREGLVVRTLEPLGDAPFSFKAVSQPWLLKHAA